MSLIVRFRSRDGQFRLPCEANTKIDDLVAEIVSKAGNVDLTTVQASAQGKPIEFGKSIAELGFRNGEMVNLEYTKKAPEAVTHDATISGKDTVQIRATLPTRQSALDDELDAEEGWIKRGRSSLCRHGDKGMCEYCSPLPPWDKDYQADHNIKHISFHAYIKELNETTNKGDGSYIPPLSESNFAINRNCGGGHEPWPKGICSKCQPSAITLQRQPFRMVDHVEFLNSDMVNTFINAWRMSGLQRIGLLFGRYAKYDKIPLGLKCEVEAIYELPQRDEDDGLILEKWMNENDLIEVNRKLGLEPVGIIFTDLSDAGKGDGSVICKRHADSFFLSSLEIVNSIKWQLKYRNKCKWSESGEFSSKFVTCVVSGNPSGEIDVAAYQASEASEALLKADIICPSTHPDQMFLRETSDTRYVPEVFYQGANEYGVIVKHNASPSFPVEYLIVSLTHGFSERGMFTESSWVENRGYLGEPVQSIQSLPRKYTSSVESTFTNWHVLVFVALCGILSTEEVNLLLQRDPNLAESHGWKTLRTVSEM